MLSSRALGLLGVAQVALAQGPPRIHSVYPSFVPQTGLAYVTLRGSGFTAGSAVSVAGVPALEVDVLGPDVLVARVPAGAVGPSGVDVTNAIGTGHAPGAIEYTVGCGPSSSRALQFDGAGAMASAAHDTALNFDLSQDFTVEGWFRCVPSSLPVQILVMKWLACGPNIPYPYRVGVSGGILGGRIFNGVNVQDVGSNTRVDDDSWHHFAYQRQSGHLKLYLDGRLEQSVVQTLTGVITNSNSVVLGRQFGCGGVHAGYLNGKLDEIRIWSVARSQSELRQFMSRRLRGDEPGLQAYWRLDEGSGQTSVDLSGHMHALSLAGAVWTTDVSPVLPCNSLGVGQSNSPTASLAVNGVEDYSAGPFLHELSPGTALELAWHGPAGALAVLAIGNPAPMHAHLPGIGTLDLAPLGADYAFSLMSSIGSAGSATQTLNVPALVPGEVMNMQGLLITGALRVWLTAAHYFSSRP